MNRNELFFAMQFAATVYALWRGGAPERVTGSALLMAFIATIMVRREVHYRFVGVEVGVMAVDVILLIVMVAITLHADRHWLGWAAAFHAMATGAHFAKAISPDVVRRAYAVLGAAWSYPIIILLVIGTIRHSRRIRARGWDLDWSRQDPSLR